MVGATLTQFIVKKRRKHVGRTNHQPGTPRGHYLAAFDPLNSSSTIWI